MKRAFTLMEAMVVLALIGIVVGIASSLVVALMNSAKDGRAAVAAIASTRTAIDFVQEEARGAGGPDLPEAARVLIDKGGGQNGTDVLWIVDQNPGYAQCNIVGVGGAELDFAVVDVSGTPRCCFEVGDDPIGTPPLASPLSSGSAFRRAAVITDPQGRFLPVFLLGDPSAGSCRLSMLELPGISGVVSVARGNRPDLLGGTVTLADVKRVYVDFAAAGVRAPFGALFVHSELDGDLADATGERLRISSNTIDLRFAVGYGRILPAVADEDLDDPDDTDADVTFVSGPNPLYETFADRRGWRDTPVPSEPGVAPPSMLGISLETGLRGKGTSEVLPWTRTPSLTSSVRVFHLTGRVAFRDTSRR